jgi:phosphotransferase system enzyme I (PtsI)
MDRKLMKGLVTRGGSANSHTAILARTFGIPAVSGVNVDEKMDGKLAITDGDAGILIVDPDPETVAFYERRMKEKDGKKDSLLAYKNKEAVNRYGKKIAVYANIGELSDLEAVRESGADGIGLFRSEFSYLKGDELPTEDELFNVYKKLAEEMKGKRVVIRTLDIGADKKPGYLNLKEEESPALGYRAIRICLTREDIFRTQIRAILKASAYGNVDIMYPMISSLWEIKKIKSIVEECAKQLQKEGCKVGNIRQGIMVETPAAALISDILAKEVDFFSIGTNDLTQYTLGVDRQNPELDMFYDAHHEAVFRLVKIVTENAHEAGILTGMCGELAADADLIPKLMEIGIDELSVSPAAVLEVKKKIIGGKEDAE